MVLSDAILHYRKSDGHDFPLDVTSCVSGPQRADIASQSVHDLEMMHPKFLTATLHNRAYGRPSCKPCWRLRGGGGHFAPRSSSSDSTAYGPPAGRRGAARCPGVAPRSRGGATPIPRQPTLHQRGHQTVGCVFAPYATKRGKKKQCKSCP